MELLCVSGAVLAQTNIKCGLPYSVGDPDQEPDPQDLHVFRPRRSGSISQRYGSGTGTGTLPFLIDVLSGLPAK